MTTAFGDVPSVLVDVRQIKHVFFNLFYNACQAMDGRGSLTVRTYVTREGDLTFVATEVGDTGPGIAPENHRRIFEKFGQVEDRKNRVGTGLGLAFCKLAVGAHRGHIGVESEIGKGSTFWMTLPRLDGGIVAS